MTRLLAATVPVERLTGADRARMWEIFERYYADVSRETFERDLAGKNHVILLRARGEIQGFSTLQLLSARVHGRPVRAVFSGDTIIESEYWGQTALQKAFFRYIVRQKLARPLVPFYWFLISKGFKTYLLLARNFPEYWPRRERPTPSWQAAVLDTLARSKFGDSWQPERGILHFATPQGRLRESVAPIGPAELAVPDIRFFAERNPGHQSGDELCCIGRVDARLAFSYPGKLMRKLLRGRKPRP